MKPSLLVLLAALLVPASAHAEEPPPQLDLAVGVGASVSTIVEGHHSTGSAGLAAHLELSFAVRPRLGWVFTGTAFHGTAGSCPADAACDTYLVRNVESLLTGARWQVDRALHVQGSAGAAMSLTEGGGGRSVYFWPMVSAVAALRSVRGDAHVGFELRTSAMRHDDTTAVFVGFAVTVGQRR